MLPGGFVDWKEESENEVISGHSVNKVGKGARDQYKNNSCDGVVF